MRKGEDENMGVPLSEGTPKHGGPPMTMREVVQAEDEEFNDLDYPAPIAMTRDSGDRPVVVLTDGSCYLLRGDPDIGGAWFPLPAVPGTIAYRAERN